MKWKLRCQGKLASSNSHNDEEWCDLEAAWRRMGWDRFSFRDSLPDDHWPLMTSHTSFQLLTMSPEEQWRKCLGWTWYSFLLPLWQSSYGVADGLSWVTFCPCMVYSKMHYCRKTFISRDKDVFWVETSDKNRAKKVFHQSLWKEPRSWDWLPRWNQKNEK